ncbi:MAG: HAD family hydrolase [Chloroflexi bacterium]|nr:HAD family hydrolase [Chloroflexota bacterium]
MGVIRAVLWDVGGPINTEVLHEAALDRQMREALAAEGVVVSGEAWAAAAEWAVERFAPNAYAAILWRLTEGRPAARRRIAERRITDGQFELRPGIADLLRQLHRRGLLLGLAANQPAAILPVLDAAGIGELFAHREVSGSHGYRKPDVRLFLRACEDLGVAPGECVMVGDRIDNDVVPANVLGMRTVLFRTGRHIAQQPRAWDEVPDAEVWSVAELAAALDTLLADG